MKEEQQRKNVKRALKKRIAENQSKGVQYFMFRGSWKEKEFKVYTY